MTSNAHNVPNSRLRRYRRRRKARTKSRGIHRQSRPAVPQCVPSDETGIRALMSERAENEKLQAALHRQAVDIEALSQRLRVMAKALADAQAELAAWKLMPMARGAA